MSRNKQLISATCVQRVTGIVEEAGMYNFSQMFIEDLFKVIKYVIAYFKIILTIKDT